MALARVDEDREKANRIEQLILSVPQVDLNTSHVVAGGLYARTIVIPAGTILTGAVPNKDHINVVHGDISVTTDEGVKRITGYLVFPAKAGRKRVGLAHAETHWTTLIETALTEIEDIENEVTDEADMLQTRQAGISYSPVKRLEG